MHSSEERWIYLAAGPMAAIGLGLLLMPFRELTHTAILASFFLVLVVAVAQLGGRSPAVATALVAALSLDFFLTQPYLHLEIREKHDIVVFAALAACGLVVALGGQWFERVRPLGALRPAQAHTLAEMAQAIKRLLARDSMGPR